MERPSARELSRRELLAAGVAAGAALTAGKPAPGARAGRRSRVIRRLDFTRAGAGNWGSGFRFERDLILDHIDRQVTGTAIFLTGDTHLTGVFDAGARYEARAAPVGIPKPNDITLLDPFAADKLRREPGIAYAGDECHFTVLDTRRENGRPVLDVKLVREDGAVPYRRRFGARSR